MSKEHKKTFAMPRAAVWAAGGVAALVLATIAVAYLLDEPLRQRMERNLNRALKGYTVRISRLDFHPIGLSLDLEDSVITQNAHPDPPVVQIPLLSASVQWRALVFGRIVADFQIYDPTIYINLTHAQKEIEDEVPMKERGWQAALQEIYPLKINEFMIHNADVTYKDRGPFRPLHLSQLEFRAENIRNIESPDRVYPSKVQLEGVVFQRGKLVVDGHADFLATPHIAFKADMALEDVHLEFFKPIIERVNFSVEKGVLSGHGMVEYAAHTKVIDIPKLTIRNTDAEYLHKTRRVAPTEEVVRKAGRAAEKYGDKPALDFKVDQIDILNSTLGFENQASKPKYRIFISDANIQIRNLSNQSETGMASAVVKGKFMGSGETTMKATFRANSEGPDLDLDLKIENADMRVMNSLFLAYGRFDVKGGHFSFYSELKARNGEVEGYVKPMFRDMDIYDTRQDIGKNIFRQAYEGIIGGLSWILQNIPRDEVATRTNISGRLTDPDTSTWQLALGLVQNAFFKAILPGFEREAGGFAGRGDEKSGRARARRESPNETG